MTHNLVGRTGRRREDGLPVEILTVEKNDVALPPLVLLRSIATGEVGAVTVRLDAVILDPAPTSGAWGARDRFAAAALSSFANAYDPDVASGMTIPAFFTDCALRAWAAADAMMATRGTARGAGKERTDG